MKFYLLCFEYFILQYLHLLGMGYTDTSREIEALHSAMRHQVGMATLDDTKDFTFKDSSTNHTQDMTEGDGTGVFGLKAVALSRYGQYLLFSCFRLIICILLWTTKN
jgi:hypothetical protein